MARTIPKRNHTKIPAKKRMIYLWGNLQAGVYDSYYDKSQRRRQFDNYRTNALPLLNTEKCYVCVGKPEHWHHIVPLSRGGYDSFLNLVPLCRSCHKKVHRKDKVRRNRQSEKKTKYVHVPVLVTPKIWITYANPH